MDNQMNKLKNSLSSSSSSLVRIRSVRLSILATEDEVKKYEINKMNKNSNLPSPTRVSRDESIQQMGNELNNDALVMNDNSNNNKDEQDLNVRQRFAAASVYMALGGG